MIPDKNGQRFTGPGSPNTPSHQVENLSFIWSAASSQWDTTISAYGQVAVCPDCGFGLAFSYFPASSSLNRLIVTRINLCFDDLQPGRGD